MKKLNKIALFALCLLISANVTALENSSLRFGAEIDAQRSHPLRFTVSVKANAFTQLTAAVAQTARLNGTFIRAAKGSQAEGHIALRHTDILRQVLTLSVAQAAGLERLACRGAASAFQAEPKHAEECNAFACGYIYINARSVR